MMVGSQNSKSSYNSNNRMDGNGSDGNHIDDCNEIRAIISSNSYDGVDEMSGDALRPLVMGIITTIRVKLDIIEADVEKVTTLDDLNLKKHYLSALQEITKILAAFPRSDGYEAKDLPESFSGKPRLIAFRNNANFMLWENNSKLHLINDYITSTDAVNKLALVLNVIKPIKELLHVIGENGEVSTPQKVDEVNDTAPIVAHLNEFAERRWAERGRQIVRPARYSATTFAGASRKFMEKMRMQVDYTLEHMSDASDNEESLVTTRFSRSPSVSAISTPVNPKIPVRREKSNGTFIPPSRVQPLSPYVPDYSRPLTRSVPTAPPKEIPPSPFPPDILRSSDPTDRIITSAFTPTVPGSRANAIPRADSNDIVRSSSFPKTFVPPTVVIPSSNRSRSPSPQSTSGSAYPSSPPSSPPLTSAPTRPISVPFRPLVAESSSSSISSASPRSSNEFSPVSVDDDREDPFDVHSVQQMPSFNVNTNITPAPSSRFTSYSALLSPVLPPHPSMPVFPQYPSPTKELQRDDLDPKPGIPEHFDVPENSLLRRSSSDNLRVASVRRANSPEKKNLSRQASSNVLSSSGSRLKFEMKEEPMLDDTIEEDEGELIIDRPELGEPSDTASPDIVTDVNGADKPAAADDTSISSKPPHLQHQRKRNLSISFAFHALSRNLRGSKDRDSGRWSAASNSAVTTSTPAMRKMEDAIISRAASFKSDWPCPISPSQGYRIDMGSTNIVELPPCMNVMDIDLDICYYQNEFVGVEHYNFLGHLRGINGMQGKPVSISVKFVKTSETSKFGEITALVRTIERDERVTIAFHPTVLESTPSRKRLVKLLQKNVPRLKDASIEEVKDNKLNEDLVKFEMQLRVNKYKFGVLYCQEDQTEENDIYSNVDPSSDFKEFLQVLGDTIELKGWKNFRGGLDVKDDTTGSHSVYTKWNDYEVMFHVAPNLPYDPADEQRVERKRHIGNDIVVCVFKEGSSQINPAIFKSHFNHVFMVVQKDYVKSDAVTHYRVSFVCKDEVPVFGPMYPHSYSFSKNAKFREFMLTKLVNAERGSMHSPVFFSKTKRTRQELLQGFISTYLKK